MTDFVLFGVSVSTIVKRLVNLLKTLGIGGDWCLVAAIACGGAMFAIRELMAMYPQYDQWFNLTVGVICAGLWASELYDLGQSAAMANR